jgi:hypothetical protein
MTTLLRHIHLHRPTLPLASTALLLIIIIIIEKTMVVLGEIDVIYG